MARLPALTTSFAVHALAFAAVVLVPIFDNEPLPAIGGPPPPISTWPLGPKIVLADSRRLPPRPRTAAPRVATSPAVAAEPSGHPIVPSTFEVTENPIDPGPDLCERCSPGDSDPNAVGTGGPSDAAGPGPGDGSGGPFTVGGQIRQPTKLRHVDPEYPELARRAGIRGEVVLECLIDASGRITDVRVLSGHKLLAPAAVSAVSRWLYSPTQLNGAAVPVLLTVTVRFNLGR